MRRDIYQAIADPTSRARIALLAVSAMTPNAISLHFGGTRQGVSNHLQMLADCGAVDQARHGREFYYHFNFYKMKALDH